MVHSYKLGGLNIIIDVYSGSIHVVDDATFDIIEMYENNSQEEIKAFILEKYPNDSEVSAEAIDQCFEQLEELKTAGLLKNESIKNPLKSTDEMTADIIIYYDAEYNQYISVYCDTVYGENYYKDATEFNTVKTKCAN